MSQGFLLLAILTVSPSIQVSPAAILGKLVDSWNLYKEECLRNNSRDPLSAGLVCNRTFDNYVCWPDGQPNTTVSVACPWYLPWHHKVQHGMEYQQCDTNGQWLPKRNSSECESTDEPSLFYGQFLSPFRIIYSVGYSLSLVALVLALGILICFRKLHCMRNNIHMNLFASFILRAMSILIKDALLEAPNLKILTHDDISSDQGGFPRAPVYPVEVAVSNETMVACRIALVMMQYSIMANSYWLLVEGIYLHNLLVITVFTERNYFNIYLCIGWGTPLIVLVPWVIVKYMYENQECWVQNINMHYWWIIRSPILLAVVINFLIFVHIIKILVSKLRAHQMRYTDYKFSHLTPPDGAVENTLLPHLTNIICCSYIQNGLAKSTLTLIPLLGIHQVVFIFVTDESTQTTFALRLTRVFVDLFFTSFQGLLVAILYCFVNKEVQSEVLKKWKRWKLGRNIEEEYRHTYSHPPGGKSGSLLHNAPGLPRHPASATCGDLLCNHPEEKHTLMASCRNCRKGAVSSCTLVEDISLTDKVQCYEAPPMENTNRESHL